MTLFDERKTNKRSYAEFNLSWRERVKILFKGKLYSIHQRPSSDYLITVQRPDILCSDPYKDF